MSARFVWLLTPMLLLILGLVLFLGVHSVRIVADGWRGNTLARIGEGAWKGSYSLISAAGLVAIVWGYGLARQEPLPLWAPLVWMRHPAALLNLIALIMIAAAYVPRNQIKAALKHPMLLGIKVWAFAHLLANHTLADVLLFGGFLVWAVLCFRAARARDRAAGTVYPAGEMGATMIAVVAGVALWAVFAFWAHAKLIGVAPM